ncbi:MAG: polyketide beta-ketoacyl:ACP synthase [Pseudomonadota bacterium]|nr:polyketide beta-ketoacyl:ACP synthase [Pseudomonadota bacterium]
MAGCDPEPLVVSGIGVTSAIGQGRQAFIDALLAGEHRFSTMRRPGRQFPQADGEDTSPFIGAEIAELRMPGDIGPAVLRNASWSAQVALATLHEAWSDAGLDGLDPQRVGLIIGGSNFQQRELLQTQDRYRDRPEFLRPTYAMSFMDTDLCGLCSEVFGIRGLVITVGGASASGQLAAIQAAEAVRSGQLDACIAMGALMDLSYLECQAFRSLGAMGSNRYAGRPELACRPFDRDRDGFIFGEACGAIVIRRAGDAEHGASPPYAQLKGWAMAWDGNRNPNPSLQGEMTAIRGALAGAGVTAGEIDYINPHGTASPLGDETELAALRACGLEGARINATKSLIGHGLSAAGMVELIAVMLQMQSGKLHPSRNLNQPLDEGFGWVGASSTDHRIERALNMSMGFGGINTAVCLQRC